MGLQDLALPVDIPWKRLCASADMMDNDPNDEIFPPSWRSSVAVFYHEPEDVPGTYCDRTITYLKVVSSITGYQVGAEVEYVDSGVEPWHVEQRLLGDVYHPCYGALLQVAVYPGQSVGSFVEYPYITDFEPKRRELYEAVTQSGEILGRSTSTLNIRKGATSADTTERAAKVGAEVSASSGVVSGKVSAEVSGKHGTASEEQNIRTTDDSREKRETYGSSTNLTQMYELFTAYHLGTNRAVFVLTSRPHTVEEKDQFTFVNGPRRLEGIQEVFLVVNRPRSIEGLCVKAKLETAHLLSSSAEGQTDVGGQPRPTMWESQSVSVNHSGLWKDGGEKGETKDFTKDILQLPDGCKLDSSVGGGSFEVDDIDNPSIKYTVTIPKGVDVNFLDGTFWRSIKDISVVTPSGMVSVTVTLKGLGGHGFPASRGPERFNAIVTVHYLCPKAQESEPAGAGSTTSARTQATLFLTARSISGCITPTTEEGGSPGTVDYRINEEALRAEDNRKEVQKWLSESGIPEFEEESYDELLRRVKASLAQGRLPLPRQWRHPSEWVSYESLVNVDPVLTDPSTSALQRIRAANELSRTIGALMQASGRTSGRYPTGRVDFWRTRVGLELMAQSYKLMPVDHPENHLISHLEVTLRERIVEAFGTEVRLSTIALTPSRDLASRLEVSELAARDVRAQLMSGLTHLVEEAEGQGPTTRQIRRRSSWLRRPWR